MKAIVTGGCGFIGSHIVDRLVKDEHEVTVIDNLSAECNETFYYNHNAKYIEADISNPKLHDLLDKDIDWIFHLAAESRIQPTLDNPLLACQVNVLGTCNLLEFARNNQVSRFVYSSTSAGYGLKNKIPLKETMDRDCLNPYSVTKLAGEDLCRIYYSLFNIPTVCFRYFNIYGDRQPLRGQYAPVVGLFMEMNKAGKSMSIVGDGLQRRDFTHVNDAVQANILAATTDNTDAFGEVFNVGTGKNHSIVELAEMIGGPYHHIEERPGEARHTLADNTKLRMMLNWEPTIKIQEWLDESLCENG
jgi:UDP-glucose 4-epimerase